EAQFPETAEAAPQLLAHHYTEAGLTEQAVPYWHQEGQGAVQRSAHVEAIRHLRTGLALLQTLPETPERVQRDVDMHITLGESLLATHGHAAPEVGEAYTYARQRCAHLEDPQRLFPVLRGLWNYHNVRAELQTAHALGEQLLTLAQQAQDAAMLPAAHRALGATWLWLGAVAASHPHFAQGIALYDPTHHRASTSLYGEDAGGTCRSLGTRTLWCLGYPDQALTQSQEAVTLAQQLAHPFSLNLAWCSAATLAQLRREVRSAQECAEAAISLAKEQGFPFWMAIGAILRGWALVQQGQIQEGIEQLHQGLRAHRATGAELDRPYFLALLGEAYGTIEEVGAGLTALAEAMTLADTTG